MGANSSSDDVACRLHREIGARIRQRILAPLEASCHFDEWIADFEALTQDIAQIKTDIRLLVEEAIMRENIRKDWLKMVGAGSDRNGQSRP